MKTRLSLLPAIIVATVPLPAQDSVETASSHFQLTVIQQAHAPFRAPYSGRNSLQPTAENVLSITSTLFLGTRLWKGGEIYFDPELAGGGGVSGTEGVAGFPNGEVYRVDNPAPKVFIARLFFRHTVALGEGTEYAASGQNRVAGDVPVPRLTITAGKFSLTDIFDDNRYSHDARTQFLNWALWSGAAWDYAADTRGYDWGVAAELHRPDVDVRCAAVMVPTYANGPYFDHNIGRAYSLNAEVVPRYTIGAMEGRVHVIGFLNHAFMGSYRQALALAAAGGTAPDIDATNAYSSKYGFVLSLEQSLGGDLGLFSRLSWNDGRTETWTFTEIDRSFQAGVSLGGAAWGRSADNAGIAWVVNALSDDHRDYLAAGGYGFIIGDGALRYGPEHIVEDFYAVQVLPWFTVTLDDQLIVNPAYNRDRGPLVHLVALRGHAEW